MQVDKRALQVTIAASTDPTRPTLNSVHVRDDGHLEATNGEIMVKVPLPCQTPDECPEAWDNPGDKMVGCILSATQLRELNKRLSNGKKWTMPILREAAISKTSDTKATACFGLDGDRQGIDLIEGSYPNTDQVWPEPGTTYHHEVSISAKYLQTIASLATNGQVIFRFPKDNMGPISFVALGDRPVQGVVMPMRM